MCPRDIVEASYVNDDGSRRPGFEALDDAISALTTSGTPNGRARALSHRLTEGRIINGRKLVVCSRAQGTAKYKAPLVNDAIEATEATEATDLRDGA